MINILYILVEQGVFALDKPFYYYYESEKQVKVGTRVSVNFHNQIIIGFVVSVETTTDSKEEVEAKYKGIKPIISLIDDEPIINEELLELAHFISKRYVCPLISSLQAILPKSLKPATSSKNAAKPQYFSVLKYVKDVSGLTKKQYEILRYIEKHSPLKKDVSPSIAQKLLNLGCIEIVNIEKTVKTTYSDQKFEDFSLTPAQEKVFKGVVNSNKTTSLIHGVTGSGKTEIYIKLIEETLKSGRTAVFLVPEINLTPYFCDKLSAYFSDQVSILTSGLSDSIRYMEYRKILHGETKVVVGTRSAIFAPLKNLGLIIVDEEFNDNYKQVDENPQYHAIEVAKYRCVKNHAKLVLGSATPSIETMARALNGQYDLFTLNERFNKKPLPNAKLINMTNLDNLYPGYSFLSKELVLAIKLAILKNEKVLLLLNKKGFSTFVTCDECGTVLTCDKCKKPLTYIKSTNEFKCYHCGKSISKNDAVCGCGSSDFTHLGVGIQSLENALNQLFPNEKIIRLDTDVADNVKKISAVLNEFSKPENHILIGTEMIAKGHDFADVTVVGIISIDQMLNLPFYNSNERAFQLITQCIGRAGRSDKEGRAYIQTYTNKSFAIETGCVQDYELFYKKEMENRKNAANPPYFYVSTIKFSGSNINELRNYVYKMHSFIEENVGDYLDYSYVKKNVEHLNNKYTMTIVLKYKKQTEILEFCNDFAKKVGKNSSFAVKFNIDSLNF